MAIQDHPRYSQLMSAVTALIDRVRLRQTAYLAGKSKYFQGIKIPGSVCDGVTSVTIDPTARPTDEDDGWDVFDPETFKPSTRIPYQITLHVYRSPLGWGWILKIELFYPGIDPDEFGNFGDHWFYVHHEGPEQRNGIFDQWFISNIGPGLITI